MRSVSCWSYTPLKDEVKYIQLIKDDCFTVLFYLSSYMNTGVTVMEASVASFFSSSIGSNVVQFYNLQFSSYIHEDYDYMFRLSVLFSF